MANNQPNKSKAAAATKMTVADAAKLVKRKVIKVNDEGETIFDKDKNPVLVEKEIKEEDVHAFADYPDKVVVVTTAGEKLVHVK